MKAGHIDPEQQRLRIEKLRAERKKTYDEAMAGRGNADNQFGESEDAMLTVSDVFQLLQSCEDPEVMEQFARTAVALGVIDSQEAHEWVANGTVPAA